MSPHPQITPPPKPLLPRQTYEEILSSVYADLSSAGVYSAYSYDSGYYSSLLEQIYSDSGYYSSILDEIYSGYTYPGYSFPFPTATDGSAVRTGSVAGPTGASSDSTTSSSKSSSGGMSMGAKIGIGVGVPLAILLLVGVGVFLWCAGKRKGKKSSTTIVGPPGGMTPGPAPYAQPAPTPQMGFANPQGYMPGYQQQQQQGYPQHQQMPPPQYVQTNQGPYAGAYAKPPDANVVELEHEYHFARPGVIEIGDGRPDAEEQEGKTKKKGRK